MVCAQHKHIKPSLRQQTYGASTEVSVNIWILLGFLFVTKAVFLLYWIKTIILWKYIFYHNTSNSKLSKLRYSLSCCAWMKHSIMTSALRGVMKRCKSTFVPRLVTQTHTVTMICPLLQRLRAPERWMWHIQWKDTLAMLCQRPTPHWHL